MSKTFDPVPAASLLAATWRSHNQLTELPAGIRPRTLSEGYDVQDRLISAMGEAVTGWKLGVGSPAALRDGGLERPLVGRVLASHCYRSGDTVPLPSRAPVTVELEIAFILGRDLEPDAPPIAAMEAIAEARLTFELVLSRFVNRRAVGWPSYAADNVGFEALIVGNAIDPARLAEVIRTATVSMDGKETARALSGDDLTDPVASLDGLIAHARERGIALRRGEIVSTGAIARPFDIAGRGVEIVARFPDAPLTVRTAVP